MSEQAHAVSFLASVTSESEALSCASLGADIIDAKDPRSGALGALPGARVRAIRTAVPPSIPVSATVGDPVADADAVAEMARFMASAGADIVKVGFWPNQDGERRTIERLGALALAPVRLVGVLLADRGLDLRLIAPMRDAGFAGVMLDTAGKGEGALPERNTPDALHNFVNVVHEAGMFAGLAGSLRVAHVPLLLGLQADVLGFRGGLCHDGARTAAIDPDAVREVRNAIPASRATLGGTCPQALPNAMARL
jgi:(5-formylfuran-3-yl)methyl phosphate synthase